MSYHFSKTVAMDFQAAVDKVTAELKEIGRASCRERV